MEANELRIGNYVSQPNVEVGRVEEIMCKEKEYAVKIEDYHIGYYLNHKGKELIRPIPLTEEWLLRLNAKKEKDGVFYYGRFRLIFKEAYDYWYVTEKTDKTYISKVEFVHEWQNLIFALDGEELTLKP